MSTAILNLPLHAIAGAGSLEQRHRMVMACMRLCFHDVVGELARAESHGPDTECSVVTVGVEARRHVFEDAVRHLGQQIGCLPVSVLYDDGRGAVCGPGAPPFNRASFVMPAICSLSEVGS